MAITRQDLVTTQRRYVTKVNFIADATSTSFGVTGSAFDAIGGADGQPFVSGITANRATLSKVLWTANANGYALKWGPNTASGATAMYLYGNNGEFTFERCTLRNNAGTPDGTFHIVPTGTVTGTVIMEFVL